MDQLESWFYHHVAQTSPDSIALPVSHAKGIYLYGPDGTRWIDFVSGICVNNVGHGCPEILAAIHEQVDLYLHPMVYGEAIMRPQVQYAHLLSKVLGEGLDAVYFVGSGAEAVEGALKVAKKYTHRTRIISFENSYHGNTHGALSVTGNEKMKSGYGPLLPEIDFIRFNCIDDLEFITDATAAVIVEPIQGAGGVVMPDPGFFEALRNRCTQTGALLILDEIQTGFGRTGSLFAFQQMGFRPDILLLAKALGGGMPLGAFITDNKIMQVITRNPVLGHITTFGGHVVSCAAGMALLNKICDENLLDRIPELEAIIHQHIQHPAIVALRGKGLFFSVIFNSYAFAESVRKEAYARGLITLGFLNNDFGLRINPPLTITAAELVEACGILVASIASVSQNQA